MRLCSAAPLLLATALTGSALADVYVLQNGDRITGQTVAKGKRTFTVRTPFGRLLIPRARVERILHDDGREEVINAPPTPTPAPEPPPPVELVVEITGKSFWFAWDPSRATGGDHGLRLLASLDGEPVATYLDGRLDPGEIRGALVNAFGFGPGEVVPQAGPGVELAAPEVSPGRIVLRMRLPPERAGARRLHLAYQVNGGTEAEPAWDDAVATSVEVELAPEAPARVELRQDIGEMEFARHRMLHVGSFRLEAVPQ